VDAIDLVGQFLPFIGGGLAVVVGAAAWWRHPTRRARRALRRAGAKPLGAVVEGERARVLGVARRSDYWLTAPMSGRRCLGYSLFVERKVLGGEWQTCHESALCLAFELEADGFRARVDGTILLGVGVDVRGDSERGLQPTERDALDRLGIELDRRSSVRFTESLLEVGDSVWVLGRLSFVIDPTGSSETLRGPPIKRLLGGTDEEPVAVADELSPGAPDLPQ
jgi:hypothetical protein